MNTKIKFLAHQVMMGVITIEDIPKKYKSKVEQYLEQLEEVEE